MMTKSKFKKGSKFRILTLLPLAAMLFVGIACLNGQESGINQKALTVLIDAGHGGKDLGASLNDNIREKDIAITIAKLLKEKAWNNPEINVVLTRENDSFLELSKRTEYKADLFISIHTNFSTNTEISGIECYMAANSAFKAESERIGKLLVGELSQVNGIASSLKEANFQVLNTSKCPALLLNIGFISNTNDLAFVTDKENQQLICDKILTTIGQLQ